MTQIQEGRYIFKRNTDGFDVLSQYKKKNNKQSAFYLVLKVHRIK